MHIDFKISTWERVEIPEEYEEEIRAKIKDGSITSANQVFNYETGDGIIADLQCNKLDDTDEQLSVEENGGNSTIEVWEKTSLRTAPMLCSWRNGNEDD